MSDPFEAFAESLADRVMAKIDQRLAGMVPDTPETAVEAPPEPVVDEPAGPPPLPAFPRPAEVKATFARPLGQFDTVEKGAAWVDDKTRRDLIGNARPPVSDAPIEKPAAAWVDDGLTPYVMSGEDNAREFRKAQAARHATPIEDGA